MINFSNKRTSHKKFFKLKTTLSIFALVVFVLSGFAFAAPVLAQTLDTGLQYGTATGLGTQDLRVSIMRIIQIFLGLVGIIAIIIILYGGFVWMTSAGNPERIDFAKRTLRNAAIGLVIIFSAFSIVSFIIGQLQSALVGPGGGGNPPPDGGCINCDNLGSGLIERVYPEPFARDVARNTSVMVTFKIAMNSSTIIDGCSAAPCSGNLATHLEGLDSIPNVLIYREALGVTDALPPNEVNASTRDGKTFIFKPVNNLGNPDSNTWYATTLTTDIQKADGDSALVFGDFTWKYEIGTLLDIDPPYVLSVWPEPDNQGDEYEYVDAVAAEWEIDVRQVPQVEVEASYTQPSPTTEGLSVSGIYTGTQDATITATINADGTANIDWGPGNVNTRNNVEPSAGVINLGSGLSLNSTSGYTPGSQWEIEVVAAKTSDTLRVGDTTYRFTSNNPPGVNEILIEETDLINDVAAAIASTINSVAGLNAVVSSADNTLVEVSAATAGLSGNSFVFSQTGDWAAITKTQEGQAAGLNSISNDSPLDKARNAVFIVDFNESISPDQLDLANFTIEYFDNTSSSWVDVTEETNFEISNQYKTIEIFSNTVCEDDLGNPIANSCGDDVYCWPVNELSQINPEPTNYRLTLRAGALQTCSSNADCLDPNFPECSTLHSGSVSVCSGIFNSGVAYYPSASDTPAGIIDATSPGNSLNANKDTYTLSNGRTHGKADGPVTQNAMTIFNLNDASGFGDSLVWSFYLNTNVDLNPPVISSIEPTVLGGNVSLLDPIDANFNEIMLSSTLKPGSNYNDGMCGCDPANNDAATGINEIDCNADQTCNVQGLCENISGSQEFCASDLECSSNLCVNKKYASLVDQSTPAVGWWVTKTNLDTNGDGLNDATAGNIRHTRFLESSNYGAEFGSGIKDSYQNCYQPSSSIEPSCSGSPYCCNGIGMTESQWEVSECFTGY